MQFEKMEYSRPDLEKIEAELENLTKNLKKATSSNEVSAAYNALCQTMDEVDTMGTIAMIHHTIDTTNAFFDDENDYFDKQTPVISNKVLSLYREFIASPYKNEICGKHSEILIEKMEIAVKSSNKKLISLQQEENALETSYEKLYASAKINFEGKELTVAQLTPYKQSVNRSTRRAAFEAEGGFFNMHSEQLDEIYDGMVKNRTKQAKLLGYDNFTTLGDIRMQRHGYTRADIEACRNEVLQGIVPIANKLKKQQAARIGVSDLCFYDEPLSFAQGNPTPKGTPSEILAAGHEMYRKLSPQTAEFIDFMMSGNLFDVLAKPGKAPGGYCTYIPKYKSPFIFSNFNGTAGDVDVLTHEAGHAFAAYLASKQNFAPELRSPGLESCEIHSMSMEFLTSEYHHLFFGEETSKYSISHAEDSIFFLPYGCLVDEFQQTVYSEPNLTPNQRCQLWLELERKYRPWINFENLPFYARGAGWQRQLHIYTAPFYYIDYVLAQAIALEFFTLHNENKTEAWKKYLALTEKAGTETYTGLVAAAGLETPFKAGVMEKIGTKVYDWLQKQS